MADIVPLTKKDAAEQARLIHEATQIFFETANIKVFESLSASRCVLSTLVRALPRNRSSLFPSSRRRERGRNWLFGRLHRQLLGGRANHYRRHLVLHASFLLRAPGLSFPFPYQCEARTSGTGCRTASSCALLPALPGAGLARHSCRNRPEIARRRLLPGMRVRTSRRSGGRLRPCPSRLRHSCAVNWPNRDPIAAQAEQ